ncbi:hypothetical protein [Kaistia nematophila]|uniref:Uncharacterized protein n=1 Tax=Kaistia nematophila TaxID=2994654 RepID=A0A9X3IM92_9HYPH|nr:hypothetical protein [Kaistia nematophila]MCX5569645.1 hypothetical protein [Kaistia nematophila]
MCEKLTETEFELLLFGDPWVYCGYDTELLEVAASLDERGLGTLGENSLGPIFSVNDAGRAALSSPTGEA